MGNLYGLIILYFTNMLHIPDLLSVALGLVVGVGAAPGLLQVAPILLKTELATNSENYVNKTCISGLLALQIHVKANTVLLHE